MGQGGFSTVPLGDGIGDYRVVPVRGDTFVAIAGLPRVGGAQHDRRRCSPRSRS